jgi:hypothetical protein
MMGSSEPPPLGNAPAGLSARPLPSPHDVRSRPLRRQKVRTWIGILRFRQAHHSARPCWETDPRNPSGSAAIEPRQQAGYMTAPDRTQKRQKLLAKRGPSIHDDRELGWVNLFADWYYKMDLC